jgi:drug/metabolite transporter (DMT)-like permease
LTPTRRADRAGGVLFIILAVAFFGALDTSSKIAAAVVPVWMAMWVRYVVQTLVTGAILWPRQRSALFHTREPGLQVLRALLLIGCNSIAYLSLAYMHVGEFTAVVMLTPLVLTVVAAMALHEQVSALRWSCIVGGFVGTMCVIRPAPGQFHAAMLLPLLLVAGNTAFQLLTRRMTKIDSPGTIHFYSGLVGLVLTTLALPFAWKAQPWQMWAVMGLMGILGALGHFLLILAYDRASVAVLTPYLYLQIAFAALGAWLVFSHIPDTWSAAGIALIAACGVLGTWLTAREQSRARAAQLDSSEEAIAGADVH